MKNIKHYLLLVLTQFVLLFGSVHAELLSTTYYHNDALGSPIAATSETGAVKWRENYHPYGDRINNAAAASDNSRWYTGHVHDQSTGLTYAGARYYDPVVGRFMAVDPVDYSEGNAQSFNRYAYANNNPYRYVDLDGENPDLLIMIDSQAYYELRADEFGLDMSSKEGANAVAQLVATEAKYELAAMVVGGAVGKGLGKVLAKGGVDDLLKAGQQLDRNGLTRAGRALQKHGDRSGSAFPKSTGNVAERNQQGQDILDGILKSSNRSSKPNRFGGNDIVDKNTGRGVRFDSENNMMGFLEP